MKIMNVTNLDVDWFGASVSPAQKKTKKKWQYPVATSTDGGYASLWTRLWVDWVVLSP